MRSGTRTWPCLQRRRSSGAPPSGHGIKLRQNSRRATFEFKENPMYAFDYHRPDSVAAAASLLGASTEAKLLAGGQTLIPTMKLRLASPGEIIDLSRIADLKGIERKGNTVVIGATTTH